MTDDRIPMPEGYMRCAPWLADICDPLILTVKEKTEDLYRQVIEAAPNHRGDWGTSETAEDCALAAMIGAATQVGMLVIARMVEANPHLDPRFVANRAAVEISNATILNFVQLLATLNAASGATKQ